MVVAPHNRRLFLKTAAGGFISPCGSLEQRRIGLLGRLFDIKVQDLTLAQNGTDAVCGGHFFELSQPIFRKSYRYFGHVRFRESHTVQ